MALFSKIQTADFHTRIANFCAMKCTHVFYDIMHFTFIIIRIKTVFKEEAQLGTQYTIIYNIQYSQ